MSFVEAAQPSAFFYLQPKLIAIVRKQAIVVFNAASVP